MDSFTTSIYKFQDPIENLQVKITLRKQPIVDASSTTPAQLDNNPALAASLDPPLTSRRAAASSSDPPLTSRRASALSGDPPLSSRRSVELQPIAPKRRFKSTSCVFKWQEKVFSKKEVQYYSKLDAQTRHGRESGDQDNPLLAQLPPLTRRHLEEFQEQNLASQQQNNGPLKGAVICSLVDEDPQPATPNPVFFFQEDVSDLAKNLRLPLKDQEQATGVTTFVTNKPTVQIKPVRGLHRHLHETPFRTFTIIASMRKRTQENVGREDESNPDLPWEGFEYVLCTIRAYDNGTLEVKPGFTKDITKPYPLKTDDIHTRYEYFIENYTPFPIVRAPHANAPAAVPERPLVGAPFVQGPAVSSEIRLHVFAEIIQAKGFSESPLFVEYVVDLNDNWKHYDPDQPLSEKGEDASAPLNAFSQFGRCKPDPDDPVSSITHFGFPFELHAEGPENEKFPKMYFVMHTMDYWERHQVLGYGYALIPQTPGRHEITISMWRPLGSIRDQLRSFFIGAPPEIHNPKYIASTKTENYLLPDQRQSTINKYGFKTVSSGGSISIRLDVAMHRKIEDRTNELDRSSIFGVSANWGRAPNSAVMNALARAKQRIEMIKNLKKDQ